MMERHIGKQSICMKNAGVSRPNEECINNYGIQCTNAGEQGLEIALDPARLGAWLGAFKTN